MVGTYIPLYSMHMRFQKIKWEWCEEDMRGMKYSFQFNQNSSHLFGIIYKWRRGFEIAFAGKLQLLLNYILARFRYFDPRSVHV